MATMNIKSLKLEKPKAGLLLIASPRFRDLGKELLGGSYDERKLAQVEEMINSLNGSLTIVNPGIIYERGDLNRSMDLFMAEKVDFIIAEFLSWAEDFNWVRFLRDMPDIPVLFINTAREKVTFDTTIDEDDFIDFLSAGNLVGSLEASGSIPRVDRKNVKIVLGSRKELLGDILSFSKAAKVRSIMRNSTFGLLSGYNDLMWSTYIDPYNFFTRVGPELKFISYSTLADEIQNVTDKETTEYQNELKSNYSIADDVDNDKLFASVRASVGIAKLSERLGIDAMVFNDVDPAMFELIGLRPGFYHPSFNSNKTVLVPEADMGAGTITYIMKLLTGKNVNFIEPFHIETAYNTFAAGHAGPNDHNDEKFSENVLIARDVRFAKTNYMYAGAPFAWNRFSPGLKTMAQFTENNGSYKIICTLVESLPGKHLFASYSHSIFRPEMPVKELFEKILKIGGTQHFAIADGDCRKELASLADIMGFDFFEIA